LDLWITMRADTGSSEEGELEDGPNGKHLRRRQTVVACRLRYKVSNETRNTIIRLIEVTGINTRLVKVI
jgi:hypothetical protein